MKFIRNYPLLVFLAGYFVVRLPFLNWYSAPLKDELYILDQAFFGPRRRLPMLPSLIDIMRRMSAEPWWSGKFISSLAGVLTVIPTFYMAKKLTESSDDESVLPWLTAVLVVLKSLLFSIWGWIPWGLWIYWRVVVNSAKGSYASTLNRNLKRIDPAYL